MIKTYIVFSQIGSTVFDYKIEADYFRGGGGERRQYHFINSITGEEWYFPVNCTVVKIK